MQIILTEKVSLKDVDEKKYIKNTTTKDTKVISFNTIMQ